MEKIWLKEYPQGIPSDIDLNAYSSLVELLEESFARFVDIPAFVNCGTTLNYSEIDSLSARFATFLRKELGISKGDRVAIMLPNILQYPIAFVGILRAGGVVVNVNPQYSERELKHQLNDAAPKGIIAFVGSTDVLANVVDDSSIEKIVVARHSDLAPLGSGEGEVSEKLGEYVPFKDTIDPDRYQESESIALSADDVAVLQYTGGTTGLSKGAVLTHRNLVANVMQTCAWLAPRVEERRERVLTALPLYHIFALTINCLYAMRTGSCSVLVTDPRDLVGLVESFNEHKYTFMTGVNTLYNNLLHIQGFNGIDFKLRTCLGGGAAVQEAVAKRWKTVTGCAILEGYGLSETSPLLCVNRHDTDEYTGTIGLPVPSTDIVLLNDAGEEQAHGEPGELCARGPQVMRGYWNRDQDTREVMTEDGFFRTGDIATMDEKGYFKIVDRRKEMILVSGFNVYPNEIESVVAKCEGVKENACIGIPDDKSGEAVKVYVVKEADSNVDSQRIISFCKSSLAGYKVPRQVEFIDELPKSAVGKILRRELRDLTQHS